MFSLELQIKTKPGFCQPKKKEEEILSTELSWQHWNRSPRSLPGVGHQVGQGAGESWCFDGLWWRFGGTEVTGTRSARDAQTGPGFFGCLIRYGEMVWVDTKGSGCVRVQDKGIWGCPKAGGFTSDLW